MKKTFSCILVLSMILTLCACGSAGSSESSSSSGSSSVQTPAPDFVYKSEFTTIEEGTRNYYTPQFYTDDGVCASADVVVGSRAPEGVVEEYMGQYDITEPRIFFISNDGVITTLSDYTPTPAVGAEDGQYDFDSNVYLSSVKQKSNGNLLAVESMYISYMDEEDVGYDDESWSEHYHFSQKCIVKELNQNGAEVSSFTIDIPENASVYSQGITDNDGNLLATTQKEDGSNCITAFDSNGEIAYKIPTDSYVESIFSDNNGSVYAVTWGDTLTISELDFSSQKLQNPQPIPSDAYYITCGGGDYPMYYTSGTNFYGITPGSNEGVKLFNWLNLDIKPDNVGYTSIDVNDSGDIRCLSSSYDNSEMSYDVEMLSVKKVPYDPSAEKNELVLATQYLDWDVQNAIVDFNRKNPTSRIVVKDYSEFNTEEDYSAGTTKLTTEIIAGNAPDIICLSGQPTAQFATKGILEDLYPFIESDSEIKLSDYYQNILAAGEYNGKLLRTITYFYLNSAVGAASLVGDRNTWTYEEFYNCYNELKSIVEDATPFDISTTRDDILSSCLSLEMNDFVNWQTGEVNFNNEEFYSILKFAKQFPKEFNWDDYNWETDSSEARISQGRQMLYRDTISTTESLNYIESCFMGADVSFVGYPTNSGCGNMISLDSGYAMSSTCSDKEAAWQFLRMFFTEKYYDQYASYMGFSPIKSVLEGSLKDATTVRYQVGDNGEYVLDDDGNRIPEERTYAVGNGLYTFYALDEDIANSFLDIVSTCTKVYNNDTSIIEIVTNEAEAFFQGQKSAEEVAKLIQSKVNIYVNEQR